MIKLDSIQSDTCALRILENIHPNGVRSQLYANAAKAAACARQAASYDFAAQQTSIEVNPLLRYYALLHWMKALLFLQDLNYPATTSVLQHGLSMRRLKKGSFRLTLEYVHVYKEGVLQSALLLNSPSLQLPSRLILGDLFGQLPRLHQTVQLLYPQFIHSYPVDNVHNYYKVSRDIASIRNMTVDEWRIAYLLAFDNKCEWRNMLEDDTLDYDNGHDGTLILPTQPSGHPWYTEIDGGGYIVYPHQYPTWCLHFTLLFALSGLCRYNPVEWSDIVHWSNDSDAQLVREYLKVPYQPQELLDAISAHSK